MLHWSLLLDETFTVKVIRSHLRAEMLKVAFAAQSPHADTPARVLAGLNRAPVSYTHLDVYKRQEY